METSVDARAQVAAVDQFRKGEAACAATAVIPLGGRIEVHRQEGRVADRKSTSGRQRKNSISIFYHNVKIELDKNPLS